MPRNLHMEVHKVLCLSRIKCANLFINATSNGEPAPATGASGVTAIIGPMEVGGTLFQPLFQRAKLPSQAVGQWFGCRWSARPIPSHIHHDLGSQCGGRRRHCQYFIVRAKNADHQNCLQPMHT